MSDEREEYVRKNFKKARESLVKRYMKNNKFFDDFAMDNQLPLLLNNNNHPYFGIETLVMQAFSINISLENIPRLTEYYNSRCLPALKTHFPQFFEDLRRADSYYAKEVALPCEMKYCNEEQLNQQIETINQNHRFSRRYTESSDYKDFLDSMREERVEFKPTSSKLIVLLSRWWNTPVHNALMSYIELALVTHSNGLKFTLVNNFLRGIRDEGYERAVARFASKVTTIQSIIEVFPGLLFPFTTDRELVVYRADDMELANDSFVVKGILSTTLAYDKTKEYGEERKLKIVMPRGTPFLPMIIYYDNLAEIALLPGTELELVEKKQFENGIYAEYIVTKNPPEFSDVEIATIMRALISSRLEISEDVPSEQDNLKFFRTLVNKKYGVDW